MVEREQRVCQVPRAPRSTPQATHDVRLMKLSNTSMHLWIGRTHLCGLEVGRGDTRGGPEEENDERLEHHLCRWNVRE